MAWGPALLGPRATPSYDDLLLQTLNLRKCQRHNLTIYFEMSENPNVYSGLLSVW